MALLPCRPHVTRTSQIVRVLEKRPLCAVASDSAFSADAESERADSSVNALFCMFRGALKTHTHMCVLLRSRKPGQKGMGVCCPF